MAKRVITTTDYLDDLDGSTVERTIAFAFDGTAYEIDLNKKNITAMTKALRPYVEAGRKAKPGRTRKPTASRSTARTDLAKVRAWANANGHEVSDRGRVPAAVLEAYDAAN